MSVIVLTWPDLGEGETQVALPVWLVARDVTARPVVRAVPVLATAVRAAGVRAAGVLAPAVAVPSSAVLAPVDLTEAQLVALSDAARGRGGGQCAGGQRKQLF